MKSRSPSRWSAVSLGMSVIYVNISFFSVKSLMRNLVAAPVVMQSMIFSDSRSVLYRIWRSK